MMLKTQDVVKIILIIDELFRWEQCMKNYGKINLKLLFIENSNKKKN